MNTFKVPVKATVLKSLIENRGISHEVVAEKANLDVEQVKDYCREDSEIEHAVLVRLAKVFHKQWNVFLLDKPEPPAKYGQDHRTLHNRKEGLGIELIKHIQDANFMLEVSEEIDGEYKVDLPLKSLDVETTNADKAGEEFRRLLKLDEDQCDKISSPLNMFNFWKDVIQGRGIYIAERGLPVGQARAFSMRKGQKAIIVLSTKDSYTARSFSLFHEVCHILIGDTGVCDLNSYSALKVEQYCNMFAAAFLAPSDKVAELVSHYSNIDDPKELTEKIAKSLKISNVATSIRLNDLGIEVPIDFHLEQYKRYKGNTKSGGNYYLTSINAAGVSYSKQVFNAVTDDVISRRDAAHFLGVGEKSISQLKTILYRFHPDNGNSN